MMSSGRAAGPCEVQIVFLFSFFLFFYQLLVIDSDVEVGLDTVIEKFVKLLCLGSTKVGRIASPLYPLFPSSLPLRTVTLEAGDDNGRFARRSGSCTRTVTLICVREVT